MEKRLKPKEKLFCIFYCQSRSPRLAAANAGYGIFTKTMAAKLISRTDIQSEIERIDSCMPISSGEIISGYRKIAFGCAADAFRLVLSDEPADLNEIETLDLANVSEIKRPKGGGLEIKFFDRLKALEKLSELSDMSGSDELMPFYDAIERSAAASDENDA
ncbi:MAG: terminase small subunit [Clostridia bacterium]|nr:terminase small subunit [Clostridia bacterium]